MKYVCHVVSPRGVLFDDDTMPDNSDVGNVREELNLAVQLRRVSLCCLSGTTCAQRRPASEPIFHTSLLGRPSGHAEGAIRHRQDDLGHTHAK